MEIQVSSGLHAMRKTLILTQLFVTDGDLCALIKARQSSREQKMDNFFESLEQKYARGSDRKNSKVDSSSSKRNTSSRGGKTRKGKVTKK